MITIVETYLRLTTNLVFFENHLFLVIFVVNIIFQQEFDESRRQAQMDYCSDTKSKCDLP